MRGEENTDPFEYQSLDSTDGHPSIRLIELLPESDSDSDGIQCNLYHFKFNGCPDYETLSYCWGPTAGKVSISCNGRRFEITTTLASALRLLRKGHESRMLWIDQIAINQGDDEEKTEQVALMRDIFQRSKRTIAWLGDPSSTSDVAIDYCNRMLSDEVLSHPALETLVEENALRQVYGSRRKNRGVTEATSAEAVALARLMKRPWFTRIWIVQEVGASDEVVVVCGTKQINFDLLSMALCMSFLTSKSVTAGRPEYFKTILFLSSVRNWRDQQVPMLALSALLSQARKFHSTDPRDKLFALYGLTSTKAKSIGLYADYALTTEQAYTQAVFALLRHKSNLELLELPRGKTKLRQCLPSWVADWSDASALETPLTERLGSHFPDWGSTRMRPLVLKVFQTCGVDRSHLDDEEIVQLIDKVSEEIAAGRKRRQVPGKSPLFASSKNSQCPPPVLEPHGILCLSGHIVDKINYVGQVLEAPDLDLEQIEAWGEDDSSLSNVMSSSGSLISSVCHFVRVLAEWDDMAMKQQPEEYPTGESRATVYCKTLCGGCFCGTPEETENNFRIWRAALYGTRLAKRINFMDLKTPGIMTLLAACIGPIVTPGFSREFPTMMEPSLQRRLARTAKGYLALLPAEAQEGDMVAILKGGRLPFVLRSRGGPWELIGACYVHGIMHGEAFDEDSCGQVRLT